MINKTALIFNIVLSATLTLTSILTLAGTGDGITRDFGYGNMEIFKIDNGTHQLQVEDLDGDGMDDILFLNNTKSRLEILFRNKNNSKQDSGLIDDLFVNKGMMTDQNVSMYRVADLNGDKKSDIITMGTPLGLNIRWQNSEREFSSPTRVFLADLQNVNTIQTGDINEDGMEDIIVSRRNNAEILWNDKKHTFRETRSIPYAGNDCFWIELIDANQDGHLDLLQYFRNQRIPLKVRLGDGTGNFGIAHVLSFPRMKSITLVRPNSGNPLMLSCVLNNMLGVRLYEFEKSHQPSIFETQEFTPQRLSIPDKGSGNIPWTHADFNDDGYDDIIVSSPKLSQLNLYKGCSEGLESTAEKYDTLTDVDELSLLKNNDILVVSKKEKAAGIHRSNNMGAFPELLNFKGELISATAISGTKSIYLLRRDEDQIFIDHFLDTEYQKSWPLKLDNDPSKMQAFVMDTNLVGLMLYIDYSTPEMVLLGTNGVEKITTEKFRALSESLKPEQVFEPIPGSGDELIIAGGKTVRKYDWKDGAYNITQQFNPMNEQAQANLACSYKVGKRKGLMVYDSNSKNLLIYNGGKTKEPKKIHIADGAGSYSGLTQLKNKARAVFIMVGDKDISLLVDGGNKMALKEQGEYMSASEKPSLRITRVIEIGKPARPAIAVVDAANRSIEIISKQPQGIKKELTIPVFLRSDMVGPVNNHATEPHDIASGDINGDGFADIVLLVHDKLLIYPGE